MIGVDALTLETVNAGLHCSLRMSRHILPLLLMLGCRQGTSQQAQQQSCQLQMRLLSLLDDVSRENPHSCNAWSHAVCGRLLDATTWSIVIQLVSARQMLKVSFQTSGSHSFQVKNRTYMVDLGREIDLQNQHMV